MFRDMLVAARSKKVYPQRYEKTLMRWGSGLFWVYFFQCVFGIFIALGYCLAFDTGLPGTIYLWWETYYGSMFIRLHSEFGNLVFLFMYGHVTTKLWTSVDSVDSDGYSSWISGALIFVFTYVAGVTGAIMPCSTLGEVTATITGSAIASLAYVKFDFLETILIPGMVLTEESIFRTFIVHVYVPLLALALGFFHMILLHKNKYSAAGGFKRMSAVLRLRASRRWRYSNRYWGRAFGT
jgi:quinol-cytochrome oxidoreductase complex cytochrome b subunit